MRYEQQIRARRRTGRVSPLRWLGRVALYFVATVSFTSAHVAAQDTVASPFADAVRWLIDAPPGRSTRGDGVAERQLLHRLYRATGNQPLWSVAGHPTDQALPVIDVIANPEVHGLRLADYDIDALRAQTATLVGSATSLVDVARFDVSLSRSLIRLLGDLHRGRVDPHAVGFHLPHGHEELDLSAVALGVSRASDVTKAISAVAPPYAGYAALMRALARYRVLAADTSLRPPAATSRPVRPGDRYVGAATLRRLLTTLGDFAPEETVPTDSSGTELYAGPLVDAIASFQRRHGLEPDGIIGPSTMAQLRVPMAQRVRQIELTLERWRWLPDHPPPRYAVVNIPAFRLYVFENDSTAALPVLAMNVIVGQARRHATPVFTGEMREIVFRPYWDVPPRIARNELVPLIRRRPGYFDREALEIVRTGGASAITYAPTSANLARVAAGTLRLRQRPGPNNALGLVKFVFPNDYNVYLHGTPARSLFAHARRDFSHGCIRAEDPTALAELVLRGQAGWDRPAIEAAMHGEHTMRVSISRRVMVFVLYATVVARGDVTYFYPDLYGRDAALARALALPLVGGRVAAGGQ